MSIKYRTAAAVAIVAIASLGLLSCSSGSTSPIGMWGDPEITDQTSIEFLKDGTIAGTDGCNRVFGDWEEKDGSVVFGALGSTMMYCEGVETWLTDAATAKINGNTMTFADRNGSDLGSLDKQ